jgi:hypothetical protein
MAIRELTDAERAALDEIHAHKTDAHSPICPHCLQLQHIGGITTMPGVVRCPDCGKLFVAWRHFIPETKSAPLPEISPPAAK